MARQDPALNYDDRRAHPRVPLDAPYFVTVRRHQDARIPALLMDCGRGGGPLALPPEETETRDWLSSVVIIFGLPSIMDKLGSGCGGTVTWVSAERCGVRFQPPLEVSDADLVEFTDGL